MNLIEDEETYLTREHMRVFTHLATHIGAMEEVEFPPYRVDIYLPDYHVGVEVDGPRHSPLQTKKRDEYLMKLYRLPIHHVRLYANLDEVLADVQAFLNVQADSKDERWAFAEDRVPWL